jgi:F0F1-type ATP synthase membrane subunit b/b'
MRALSFVEYEALRDRALRWGREIATDIKQHITTEVNRMAGELRAEIVELRTNVSNQIEQVSSGLVKTVENLTTALNDKTLEADELRAQLEPLVAEISQGVADLDAFNTELKADDPAPEPPVEPTP